MRLKRHVQAIELRESREKHPAHIEPDRHPAALEAANRPQLSDQRACTVIE
jgi:hypothetical protein